MIAFIENWILIRLMIRRLKKDAVKHHLIISAYSQALINCAITHKKNPVIKNGFWCIGNVEKECCRLADRSYQTEPVNTWIKLSSWNESLKSTKLKEDA